MKKILKYTAFAAMVGLFSSCSDSFFEAESGDIITSDQMDEVDPVAGLNGMYAYLYKFDTMGSSYFVMFGFVGAGHDSV